jgi:hypothetical protein
LEGSKDLGPDREEKVVAFPPMGIQNLHHDNRKEGQKEGSNIEQSLFPSLFGSFLSPCFDKEEKK